MAIEKRKQDAIIDKLSTQGEGENEELLFNGKTQGGLRAELATFDPVLLFDKPWKYMEAVMDDDIVLSKAESGNIPQSYIELKITGNGSDTLIVPDNAGSGFHKMNDVTFDNTKVNALFLYYDRDGRVRWTMENLETVIGLTQLSAPANPYASAGGQDSINTGCDTVANASGYQVYVSLTGQAGTFTLLASPSENAFTHEGLDLNDTRYYYWIALGDNETYSNSNPSTTVSATTSSSIQISAPVLDDIVTVDSISNDLSWSNPDGEESFDVYRRETGTSEWGDPIANVAANTLTYRDNTCTPEQAYDYSVIAKGNGTSTLDSPRSNVKNVIAQGVATPTLTLISGDGQITATPGNIDQNATATEMIIGEESDYSDAEAVSGHVSLSTDPVEISSLTNGTRYYLGYRAAITINGTTKYSEWRTKNIMVWTGFNDDFAGTTIDATKWSILSGDVTQNNVLVLKTAAQSSLLSQVRSTGTADGIIWAQVDFVYKNTDPGNSAGIFTLWDVDGGKAINIAHNGTNITTTASGGYSHTSNIPILGKTIAISYDGETTGRCWYWDDDSWVQIGDNININLGKSHIDFRLFSSSLVARETHYDNLYLVANMPTTQYPV